MRLTTQEEIEYLKIYLLLLREEVRGYLDGEWVPEYYMTIGYNKVFTGRKIYR